MRLAPCAMLLLLRLGCLCVVVLGALFVTVTTVEAAARKRAGAGVPSTPACAIPPVVSKNSCQALRDLGCNVRWVGLGCLRACATRPGGCGPGVSPRWADGGCQPASDSSGLYCGFQCRERCVAMRGCEWHVEKALGGKVVLGQWCRVASVVG